MAAILRFAETLSIKHCLPAAFFIVMALCFLGALPKFSAKVVGVSEGDTITVIHGDTLEVVRLYGIDAPENSQPFGAEAEKFASGIASGKIVTVLVRGADRFHQTIADVLLPDGRMLAREVVKNGFAWWDPKAAPEDKELQTLQAEAKAAKRGLWADPHPVPPWEWQNPVHVPAPAPSSQPAPVAYPSGFARPAGGPAGPMGSARPAGAFAPNRQPGAPNQPAPNRPSPRGDGANPRPNRRNPPPNRP